VKNVRAAFDASGHSYGISVTLPTSYWYLQHFDVVGLEQYVDWFNVMTYDLHGKHIAWKPSKAWHLRD
jgi:chitinase